MEAVNALLNNADARAELLKVLSSLLLSCNHAFLRKFEQLLTSSDAEKKLNETTVSVVQLMIKSGIPANSIRVVAEVHRFSVLK